MNGVMKRAFLHRILAFYATLPTPLGYEGKESLTTYGIGLSRVNENKHFVASADQITVIQQDEESSPICDVVGDLLSTCLLLLLNPQMNPHTGQLLATR